jgi:hypothetical protein
VAAEAVRIGVIWAMDARSDLRTIDREMAMQILHCIDRYLANRNGDVKKLKPPRTGFRRAAATIVCSSITNPKTPSKSQRSGTDGKLIGDMSVR